MLFRFFIPAVAVGFIVLSLGACQTLAQVDRGLYQVGDSVAQRDRVTGARTLSITTRQTMIQKQNQALDESFKAALEKGMKLNADVDAKAYARVSAIVDRILTVSHFADEKSLWKVFLVPNKDFNAFVNGGTYVVVHKGLVDQVKSDDEVAAVIGHEIGHIAANHVDERSSYNNAALLVGSDSAGRNLFQQSFSMEQEREADRIGILYASLAGYDPKAASRLWERLYKDSGNQTAISSHPLNRDRLEQTAQIAASVQAYYSPGRINPNAPELLFNNALWQQQRDAVAAGSGGGLLAVAEAVANAYAQRETAKTTEAKQQAHAETMRLIKTQLQVVSATALDPHTLELKLVYKGTRPLKVLVLAAISEKLKTRIVAHAASPVIPQQPFTLTFQSSAARIAEDMDGLSFNVDDAGF